MTKKPPLDLAQFWHDNGIALRDPFAANNPQTPMGIQMGTFCIFAELGLQQDMRRMEEDSDWARQCIEAYNDKAERVVGRRLIPLHQAEPSDHRAPHIRSVGEIFGCRRVWQSESWWLMEAAHDAAGLAALLDRVEKLDLETEMFGDDFDRKCQRAFEATGRKPQLNMSLRGPVTLATSIYGVENLIYLIMDDKTLAQRFRDVLHRVILEYFTISQRTNQRLGAKVGPKFSFFDDNCAMLTPEMYEFFGLPIVQSVYDTFAPGPNDLRYQHSDSDMAHLLPLLARTGMNRVNFGPTVRFAEIRRHMPRAVVEGTLAPFTYMRNETNNIIAEVQRDLDESRATRGLVVATAGSVNDGTLLTSLLTVMQTIGNDR